LTDFMPDAPGHVGLTTPKAHGLRVEMPWRVS